MGRKILLFCLILAQILLLQALADKSEVSEKNPFPVNPQTAGDTPAVVSRVADQPVSGESETESSELESEDSGEAQAPATRRLGKHHSDKSVAGGGVIIGGLVTAIFAAVFCYIRVTRKRDGGDGH